MKSFLKWAGGKSRLMPELSKYFPEGEHRFIEPFFGSGVVGLNVPYKNVIANDVNKDLVHIWRRIQKDFDNFFVECRKLFCQKNNTKTAYLRLRDEFNTSTDMDRRSVLFVYLNRHCFNGLCRYNSSGGFNVPFGDYENPYFPCDELVYCSKRIVNFEFHEQDFRTLMNWAGKGDVVYCDPPYFPLSDTSNFTSYEAGGFGLKEQLDLAQLAFEASERGATVIISNHYNWYSKELYGKIYRAKLKTIDVSRTISANSDSRKPTKEVIAVFEGK